MSICRHGAFMQPSQVTRQCCIYASHRAYGFDTLPKVNHAVPRQCWRVTRHKHESLRHDAVLRGLMVKQHTYCLTYSLGNACRQMVGAKHKKIKRAPDNDIVMGFKASSNCKFSLILFKYLFLHHTCTKEHPSFH